MSAKPCGQRALGLLAERASWTRVDHQGIGENAPRSVVVGERWCARIDFMMPAPTSISISDDEIDRVAKISGYIFDTIRLVHSVPEPPKDTPDESPDERIRFDHKNVPHP